MPAACLHRRALCFHRQSLLARPSINRRRREIGLNGKLAHEMLTLRRAGCLVSRCRALGGVVPSGTVDPSFPLPGGVQNIVTSCSQASPIHIEDEVYCRQRQQLVLGSRIPYLAPDAWIAPNAVVIGDVDLFEKVGLALGLLLGLLNLTSLWLEMPFGFTLFAPRMPVSIHRHGPCKHFK